MAISNTLIPDRKVVWDNPPRPKRVGALVGGLYAAGVSSLRLTTLIRDLKWLDLVSVRLPTVNWSDPARTIPMGLVDLDKLMAWIDQVLGGGVEIQQLNLPYAAVATDLLTGEI